ncbi:MAG: HAD family hydrolase [Pyrinomonadaceae bacterium]
MKDKFIFFDRDGTLIEEVDFLSTVSETKLFPFTIEALQILKENGFRFAVTTNQSGVARGYFDESAVFAIHDRIQELLSVAGLVIDSFHFCPHMPDAGCDCRKPGTGMIIQATKIFDIDLGESWVIGDKKLDIGMGINAGTKTALVETGYGAEHANLLESKPNIIAANLLEAARLIAHGEQRESRMAKGRKE